MVYPLLRINIAGRDPSHFLCSKITLTTASTESSLATLHLPLNIWRTNAISIQDWCVWFYLGALTRLISPKTNMLFYTLSGLTFLSSWITSTLMLVLWKIPIYWLRHGAWRLQVSHLMLWPGSHSQLCMHRGDQNVEASISNSKFRL